MSVTKSVSKKSIIPVKKIVEKEKSDIDRLKDVEGKIKNAIVEKEMIATKIRTQKVLDKSDNVLWAAIEDNEDGGYRELSRNSLSSKELINDKYYQDKEQEDNISDFIFTLAFLTFSALALGVLIGLKKGANAGFRAGVEFSESQF